MRIALYHAWIYSKGGGERVILELLKRSRHEIKVYTNHYSPSGTYPELAKYNIQVLNPFPIRGELFRGLSFSLLAAMTKIPEPYDVLAISTGGIAEFIAFANHDKPVLAYVHTPLRAAHDPGIYNEKVKSKSQLSRFIYDTSIAAYKAFETQAWNHISYALCNSETTRSRLLSAGLIAKSRTSVLHPGADTSKFKPGRQGKYFFYPSRFSYYKRQDLAIKAFLEFKRQNPRSQFSLILAGGVNPEQKPYLEKLKSLAKGRKDIEILADLPDKEWLSLYSNCYAALFCAINEDWGIIPIEAAAAAKPVISVDEGGPRESIVPGKSGLLVRANPKAIARAMGKLAKSPALARQMGSFGLKEARKYSWKKFVREFDNAIDAVAKEKRA